MLGGHPAYPIRRKGVGIRHIRFDGKEWASGTSVSTEVSGHLTSNGGAHPMDVKVSGETVNVHFHEFRKGFLRMN